MAGEIQEPFNLSLLANSIHSGSVSFGRFEKESLSWEKRSSFSRNRYLEEAEKFSKPGSVTQMRAHFEAHFKKKGIRFPSSVEAQTWGEVAHHQTCTDKDENLWESSSQFGDSCVSYDDILVNSDDDDHHTSLSVALEKTQISRSEDKKETRLSSSASRSKLLKNVPCSAATKTSTKKNVAITKGSSPSSNTKTSIDTKRQKDLKAKRIVKTIAPQAPTTSKKTESLIPLLATREKRTTTNGFSLRNNERAEKKKEEKVEAVVRKSLNFNARPMPKIPQARPQHTSIGQAKAKPRDDVSSKATCDRSLANGMAKSKLNVNKYKADIQRNLNVIRPKTSDQTARNNTNRRNLAVR
ncbi:Protein WVD2-like 7 [Cardamine amara subsp. amara]|uniref:Protein WVD2-like 7 n=1 Tax=Cardamine amara subsp. amara TaxID=228776 RepID=A0ABD1BM60_CARAN